MKKRLFFLGLIALFFNGSFSTEQTKSVHNNDIIFFDSDLGWDLLLKSDYRCDYWMLSRYFETQMTYAHCSVASSVIVLNALDIEKPTQAKYKNHKLFTQEDFFNDNVKKIIDSQEVAKNGMTLDNLAQVLKTFPIKVDMIYAKETTVEQFRESLKESLRKKDRFLIANFYRPSLDQSGTGHFSPIAAYNEEEDLVLIMEVSRYKYPPFWVKTAKLFEAMKYQDPKDLSPRGYIMISKT